MTSAGGQHFAGCRSGGRRRGERFDATAGGAAGELQLLLLFAQQLLADVAALFGDLDELVARVGDERTVARDDAVAGVLRRLRDGGRRAQLLRAGRLGAQTFGFQRNGGRSVCGVAMRWAFRLENYISLDFK